MIISSLQIVGAHVFSVLKAIKSGAELARGGTTLEKLRLWGRNNNLDSI